MIYSKKLASEVRDDFCNNLDLYPTICNLFGLGYNKIFCQGQNIFSSDIKNSVHVSSLTGYYSSTCYSKNMIDITCYGERSLKDVNTFKKNVCEYYERQHKLEAIYRCGWKI
jgi:arylsulfatase A-like enzyme